MHMISQPTMGGSRRREATQFAEKNPEAQISTASAEDLNLKRLLDRRLDEALEDTFPASDAVSIVISVRNG